VSGNALETVDPCDFLDQVLLDFQVEPPGRGRHDERLVGVLPLPDVRQPEPREDFGHLVRGNGDADHLAGPRDAHGDRPPLGQRRHRVGDRSRLAAADFQDQLRRTLYARNVVLEVHAALEAVRSVAREVVAPRAAGDRLRKEEGGLEEDVARPGFRLGRVPAHDAGKADGARGVGDAKDALVHFHDLLVEQLQPFPRPAEAHVDAAL
jgi:hypothetical protein